MYIMCDWERKKQKYKTRYQALGGAADDAADADERILHMTKSTVYDRLHRSCQDVFDYYDAQGQTSQYSLFLMRVLWEATSLFLASSGNLHASAIMSGTPLLPEIVMGFAAFNSVTLRHLVCKASPVINRLDHDKVPFFFLPSLMHYLVSQLLTDIELIQKDVVPEKEPDIYGSELIQKDISVIEPDIYDSEWYRYSVKTIILTHLENIDKLLHTHELWTDTLADYVSISRGIKKTLENVFEPHKQALFELFIDYHEYSSDLKTQFLEGKNVLPTYKDIVTLIRPITDPDKGLPAFLKALRDGSHTTRTFDYKIYVNLDFINSNMVFILSQFKLIQTTNVLFSLMVKDPHFNKVPTIQSDYSYISECIRSVKTNPELTSNPTYKCIVDNIVHQKWTRYQMASATVGTLASGGLVAAHFSPLLPLAIGVDTAIVLKLSQSLYKEGKLKQTAVDTLKRVQHGIEHGVYGIRNIGNLYRKLGSDVFLHYYLPFFVANRKDFTVARTYYNVGKGLSDYIYRCTLYSCVAGREEQHRGGSVILNYSTVLGYPGKTCGNINTQSGFRPGAAISKYHCQDDHGKKKTYLEKVGVCNYYGFSVSDFQYRYPIDEKVIEGYREITARLEKITLSKLKTRIASIYSSGTTPIGLLILGIFRYLCSDHKQLGATIYTPGESKTTSRLMCAEFILRKLRRPHVKPPTGLYLNEWPLLETETSEEPEDLFPTGIVEQYNLDLFVSLIRDIRGHLGKYYQGTATKEAMMLLPDESSTPLSSDRSMVRPPTPAPTQVEDETNELDKLQQDAVSTLDPLEIEVFREEVKIQEILDGMRSRFLFDIVNSRTTPVADVSNTMHEEVLEEEEGGLRGDKITQHRIYQEKRKHYVTYVTNRPNKASVSFRGKEIKKIYKLLHPRDSASLSEVRIDISIFYPIDAVMKQYETFQLDYQNYCTKDFTIQHTPDASSGLTPCASDKTERGKPGKIYTFVANGVTPLKTRYSYLDEKNIGTGPNAFQKAVKKTKISRNTGRCIKINNWWQKLFDHERNLVLYWHHPIHVIQGQITAFFDDCFYYFHKMRKVTPDVVEQFRALRTVPLTDAIEDLGNRSQIGVFKDYIRMISNESSEES